MRKRKRNRHNLMEKRVAPILPKDTSAIPQYTNVSISVDAELPSWKKQGFWNWHEAYTERVEFWPPSDPQPHNYCWNDVERIMEAFRFRPEHAWLEQYQPPAFSLENRKIRVLKPRVDWLFERVADFATKNHFRYNLPGFKRNQADAARLKYQLCFLYSICETAVHLYFDLELEATERRRRLLDYFKDWESRMAEFYGANHARDISLLIMGLLVVSPDLMPAEYIAYDYAPNGFPSLWWDPEGVLQERNGFTREAILRFHNLPMRTGPIWELWPLTRRVLVLYDTFFETLLDSMRAQVIRWPSLSLQTMLTDAAHGINVIGYSGTEFLDVLTTLCEFLLCEKYPAISGPPSDDVHQLFMKTLPSALALPLYQSLKYCELPDFSPEEIAYLLCKSPSGSAFARSWLTQKDRSDASKLALLDQVSEDQAWAILQSESMTDPASFLAPLRRILRIRRGTDQRDELQHFLGTIPSVRSDLLDLLITWPDMDGDLRSLKGALSGFDLPTTVISAWRQLISEERWASFLLNVMTWIETQPLADPPILDPQKPLPSSDRSAEAIPEAVTVVPRVRLLTLDPEKIRQSQEELTRTVQLVDDFAVKDASNVQVPISPENSAVTSAVVETPVSEEIAAVVVTETPEPDTSAEPIQAAVSNTSVKPQYQRHLTLDPEKIRQAQEGLAQIVQLVDSYVDVEIPEDDPVIVPEPYEKAEDIAKLETTEVTVEEKTDGLGEPERKLLERLLCGEEIPRGVVNDLARQHRMSVSALVGNINDYYYDEIGAQLLFFDEGKLMMDPSDREYLKAVN